MRAWAARRGILAWRVLNLGVMMKNIVMLVVLLGAIGAGVYMMMSGDPETKAAAKQDTTVGYMCAECGEVVMLTAAEIDEWIKDPDHTRYDEGQGSRDVVFKCPACGKFSVVRARMCPRHKERYLASDPVAGVKLDCPKCVKEGEQ